MHRFEGEPESNVIHDDAELNVLLQRLGKSQGLVDEIVQAEPEHRVTVQDIAEATGLTAEYVEKELQLMLAEQREAKLSRVLRELEEPLYRVERTDVVQPNKVDAVFRTRTVQMLMDRAKQMPLPQRPKFVDQPSKLGQLLGMTLVWLVVSAGGIAILVSILKLLR